MRVAIETHIRTRRALAAETGNVAVKQQDAQLRIVADELSHRMKNLVTIVQSIARQTMHESATMGEFEARFSGRLGAFGRSLDLLIANNWRGADLDELTRRELTPFGVLDRAQISVKGPAVDLNAEAARNISLTLHELATNACKYGALAVPEGRVAVHWEIANGAGERRFRMIWRESGGPMVTEPTRSGFGRRGHPAPDGSGPLGRGDTRVPARWRQVDTRHPRGVCHQRQQRTLERTERSPKQTKRKEPACRLVKR